jgi:hypothetical protein
MAERRLVGHLHLDSAQILILDPVRLGTEDEYQRVVQVTLEKKAGEVWLRDEELETTNDGIALETGSDGEFPVYVDYDDGGLPRAVYIDLG